LKTVHAKNEISLDKNIQVNGRSTAGESLKNSGYLTLVTRVAFTIHIQ